MSKIINLLVLSLFGLISASVGQIIQDGQCDDNILLQTNFNVEQFLGTWHEYARAEHPQGGDCSTIDFTRVDNAVTVYHKTVRQNFFEDHHGTASVPEGSAKLTLNMPQLSSTPLDFWVMLTDYSSFALTYRCQNIGNTQRQIFLWQLSRQTTYDLDLVPVLMNSTMINILGINSNDLREINHSDEACYALPVIAPGQPIIFPGQCDQNIPVAQNFSAGDFLGVWHEINSYYSENVLGTCGRAQYSSQDGVIVDVVNSQVINQNLLTIEGYATVASSDGSGRLNVVLQITPNTTAESELLIIATDYRQWAISYTCVNLDNNQRRVFSWIVSRTRSLPPAAQEEVDAVIDSILDLNSMYYQETDQSNSGCFYVPEVTAGEPAVFGGQCDLNIPVQPNFNAGNYLGLWHDIESFPTPFQFGTCANAYYSLGEVGVDVLNTQVVNETLNVINGVAIPVGAEAKLVVSFPIEGTNLTTETDYWVISTDYSNYSLVYSCRNLNDYQQQITMWKLSRFKTLTPEAVTAINDTLATQTVFDPRFFQSTDQSREACFYYPEPVPGEQVVFPGQCDDEDVSVVSNFNLNLFYGQWYEVEAYPKDPQPGSCIEHQFSIASNTGFNLVSSNVAEQLLGSSTSQLTFINGTDARFTLVTSNGTDTISFPYYIIATDYFNYALAYSCIDINDDFKGIFSWKLSRFKQLPSSAVTPIDNATSGIRVLSNDYFESVDQSDYACFYFPDLGPGEPVILPGQCDTESEIPLMTDFDAVSYLGRWRLIESYPSQNQVGACNQARYSLADDGTVVVRNSEVVNQTYTEAVGVAVPVTVGNETLGKLIVNFPESDVPFELWILDTDYSNYSLVYGCVNVSSQERQVWSWKMSRTTNLTAESIQAINAVISNVTVLNDRYYEAIDHSDSACFYYPEPNVNASVIFPGQCDENIPVEVNFDAVGYMNLWHDIERYPAPFQDGTCGNAYYTLRDGPTVDVFNTQVVNQTLDTISGIAVLDLVDANDTSAKLLVTFPVEGFNLTTRYWVLSTDYTSYALVYSCTNINDEYRSVTSWKLSRTKSLSVEAAIAINNVTSYIDVLDDRYYIPQDQTPEGCFYFPEPEPGEPVVFPGQCDLNISVVENFNFTRFQGLWHEIEAYPKEEQTGQCIRHEFTLDATNNLSFESFSVIAESLGITSGTVRVTSNDNSAKLELVFTSNGTTITIPYWIVDTNYDDYALAYSCVNQPNSDFRGVWSWKLSRSRQLSNTSVAAINNAIEYIDVLDNIYYEPISQSDESCFYYPDLGPGEPVIFPGQCDTNITVVQNFNASRYLGLWRLIETYPSGFQLGTCNDATYSPGPNGTVAVYNTEVINQTLSTIDGSAVLATDDGSGKLLVTFPDAPDPTEYWILETDYDTFSLVYSCVNINSDQRRVYSWKLSRTNSLPAEAVAVINETMNRVDVLDSQYYEVIDRSDENCFYYPEPDGTPVVFRGQCDENIEVVMGFDATSYMNLWHDIARYPAPFQNGTCGNAFYTLRDGPIVDVFNTQVINQALDTISGTAVLDLVDSNDTSAKLLVTFPVEGLNLTTPYWVLSTDYTSYALVYSCSNIGDEYRSVTSWKLSRTKSLSVEAAIAINNVTSYIDVLDDRYYIPQDQTPEGCFYFPEPEPGKPVVFPGQCDLNISVEENFNFTRFQGLWHEIEAYPKEEQTGQCIRHEFTLDATNNLSFESFSVIAESLGITSGTVGVTSNDNSAKLELVFTSNGTTITIPYWIVDTNYDDYALAYSCVNQPNSDFRGVWSWKLSRSRQLSNTSVAAINNAIEYIDVLDNIYYEPISQSDESCFYYPDLGPGEPVIFPGQCDTNITVVQNFNASRYLGLWRLIETYPSGFQLGTCNDATYSPGPNGTVAVYNTEVINQTLSTIDGSAVLATDDGSGKLLVTFPDAPDPTEYWILETDYDTFSLVYSCVNINSDQRRVYSWKLSRTNSLPAEAVAVINETMNRVDVLGSQYYEVIDRSDENCFYYPEPDGTPVVFRGQCDENIEVVMGFDATSYMNLWHDIARYPAPFQNGTCGNAFYTLRDGPIVDVFNTQVINQALDTISGTAVLDLVDSNDTSAKLLVTFPVEGLNLTTPYWVLSTDYTSYALVYSCSNIGDEYRSVTSWKLSRTKSLSVEAAIAINNVTSYIDVLDDRYYIPQDQTPEGCFYFPEPEPGKPVVFPGQCDLNISVEENFNFTRFQGLWHEIEAYPKEEQTGQCIRHEFTLDATNNLSFESFSVIAESLGITSGTVGVTSNDNSAKLELVFTSNGTTITIPYWIVDTNYDDYALAYSCVNQPNSDFRGVWSWKLSRSRQLSNTSVAAINNAIEYIDVLDNIYYEPISQSDESCFYYPDLGPGEPVIFPGQCDTNITVVQNFNASRYLGLWRLIETYPSGFQLGTCNDATYSPGPNGTVAVYNTEVINQTLSTIDGSAVLATDDGSGKLLVTFPDAPDPTEYWILETDYDTFSLVYSCVNINSDQRRVYSWKLSRTNSLPAEAVAVINETMNRVDVLDSQYYEVIDRSDENCFYYPEPDGTPVVFRGQCDENIEVVMGFDATSYTGTWYNLESYPAPFQDGSCGVANYDLDLETLVVAVENTQVVNQVLDVQTGTAVIALNDTSAKLLVTFEVNGVNVTTDYWVLATDYNSFAFVYSCQNLNGEFRQVNSWKLGRERGNLTTAANDAITAAINRVQVLEERYFVDGRQSEADCFFYPDNNGGDVLLDGQCVPDSEVAAVTNFNVTAFGGTWHEVARFPSDLQVGECATADFSIGAQNNVVITQTEIDNELLSANFIPGTVSGDGRGVINAEIAGIPFNTFYILDTDYEEFALVYGCRNINNGTKQVYSWKLGRSRSSLSTDANNRIDQVVITNVDLFENFYSYTGQTSNACFHYPEFNEPPATIELEGPCDESIRGIANFDPAAYLGQWIEIERYPQVDQFGKCARANYSPGNGSVNVLNTQIFNQTRFDQFGFAEVASDDGSGLLNVTFVVNDVTVHANYYILETDYTNYALVYSCRNLPTGFRQVYSWKLSRTTSLSTQATTVMNARIAQTQGLLQDYYQTTDQSDDACFHYPEFNEPPATIELVGPCDESIRGIANFDPAAYLGRWIEIERYPQVDQFGTCDRANYSPGSGNVNVWNMQIVNQTRLDQFGFAEVASDDGSGLLNVTFVVNDVTVHANYYILETDYTSYALVYSCRNLPTGFRQVYSWKLSRTTSLSTQATTVMNARIAQTEGLLQDYYQTTDQSDNACFYIPNVYENSAPMFRGQCEDDPILGVANFDATRYAGWWHEMERYPVDSYRGECISSQYSGTSNAYQVVETIVNNGIATVAPGTVEVTSNGRLRRTINGRVEDIWVLATDYDTYSLLFSCENANEYRRIWSAKHSKTKDFTPAAQTAMNAVIESNKLLYPQFYLEVSQNDSACFHYPEVSNQQVILPGQCDDSIPVVENFSVTAYEGTWYQIQRYPQIHEGSNSTCIGARYTLNEDTGVVTVLNWEVINGELETIEGNATLLYEDGSAKLSVVLPVVGSPTGAVVTTTLYVLTTDYENYALAYSCSNINPFQRSIGAWKLSRERTLSTTHNAAINAHMATREELHQPYFVNVFHDEDCEEPSSGTLLRSSIIVMIICAVWQMLS